MTSFDLAEAKSEWDLDPEVHHLNHGSYGAVPRVVYAEQLRWHQESLRNPVEFYFRQSLAVAADARAKVAKFLGQEANQIALVRNTTEAATTTKRGFPFKAGDEVIVFDQEYGAITYAVKRGLEPAGGKLVELAVPRLTPDEEVVKLVEAAITPKTVMLVVDHVTSGTARTFPIFELSALCKAHGIAIAIDASHAPGNFDTDLDLLDPDFWFGNLHKWVSAPQGVGVFRIAPRWQEIVKSNVVSWNEFQPYPIQFDHVGTVDLTPWLAAPRAIEFYENFGWDRVRKAHQARMRYGRDLVMAELGIGIDELREENLPMGVVQIHNLQGGLEGQMALHKKLWNEYKVEVPITNFNGDYFFRISGHLYNTPADYEALVMAVRKELK
jgi:isopenicillin-N epimerase